MSWERSVVFRPRGKGITIFNIETAKIGAMCPATMKVSEKTDTRVNPEPGKSTSFNAQGGGGDKGDASDLELVAVLRCGGEPSKATQSGYITPSTVSGQSNVVVNLFFSESEEIAW